MPTCHRSSGERATAKDDVAASVDREVPCAGVLEDLRGTVDGPALDEAGRVEAAVRSGVEVPARLLAELLAALQHVSDVRVSLFACESSPRSMRLISLSGL